MKILLILLTLIPVISFATEIQCFQNGKKIYSNKVHDIVYGDKFFIVTENNSNHILAIFADCMLILDNHKKVKPQ